MIKYMEQSEMLVQNKPKDKVSILLKPLYGLEHSGWEWCKKFDRFLVAHGRKRTLADPCNYVFEENIKRAILEEYMVVIYKDVSCTEKFFSLQENIHVCRDGDYKKYK